MTLSCIIADDEEAMLLILRKGLEKIGGSEVINIAGCVNGGRDAVKLVECLRPDCVFLDVEMPDGDGLWAAKQMLDIEPKLMIVFITAHQQYMPQAFELYAFDYMVKPFKMSRLRETVRRMLAIKQNEAEEKREKIMLKTREGREIFAPDDICIVERENRLTTVITDDGKYVVPQNLTEMEALLPASMFLRSHKSYIINVNRIKKISPYGRWTYVVTFYGVTADALLTYEKAKTLAPQEGI